MLLLPSDCLNLPPFGLIDFLMRRVFRTRGSVLLRHSNLKCMIPQLRRYLTRRAEHQNYSKMHYDYIGGKNEAQKWDEVQEGLQSTQATRPNYIQPAKRKFKLHKGPSRQPISLRLPYFVTSVASAGFAFACHLCCAVGDSIGQPKCLTLFCSRSFPQSISFHVQYYILHVV